jgi:UDP-N-acetylglucosamine 2-epimerase (non-hydrolysing)/UDP-GlcNAc3NAcA epimerase
VKRKIVTVVGARPEFVKAFAVSPVLRTAFDEVLVHTGQHYDYNLSQGFFDELALPRPDYNIGAGSGSHAEQTASILTRLERILMDEKPDCLLNYGDTNSTLASALAAVKLDIPIGHIEAGLRSFNKTMPEEQNRIVVDHLSSFLFCPTVTAVENLEREGITEGVFRTGDVMMDAVLILSKRASQVYESRAPELKNLLDDNTLLLPEAWYLATIHRAENTTSIEIIAQILAAFEKLDAPVIFPVHPRTKDYVKELKERQGYSDILFVEPVGYVEMLYLTANAKKVITDSGGLQKEAYLLATPCVTVRPQTEWIETLEDGWNVLSSPVTEDLLGHIGAPFKRTAQQSYYGDGHAAQAITKALQEQGGRG